MPAYKKSPHRESLLANPELSSEKISGEFRGFKVEYRNGVIYASREYKNVHAVIEHWDAEKETHVKRSVVFESVKVTAEFKGKEFFDDIVIDCGYAVAEFKLDSKKYKADYGIYFGEGYSSYSDFDNDKKRLYFKGGFSSKVMDDFSPLRELLVDVFEFDKHIAPLFKAELEMREKKKELVMRLKLEAQEIGREYDIEKNPLPLQPIFQEAKKAGVVDELIGELRVWAMNRREHISGWNEDYGPWMSLKELASGKRRESPEDMTRRHQAKRLDMIAEVLQKFNEKPTKQQEKEAADWLAFDNALKKVEKMMAKEHDWSKNISKFALRVIDEIKPICEPKKFAETLKKMMEFKQDDGVVQQLGAVFSPLYFRDFMRMLGADISEEELQELFGKGKDRVGEYVRGLADETKGRELLALSEEILKNYPDMTFKKWHNR